VSAYSDLQALIGHQFKDADLLDLAMTHASAQRKTPGNTGHDNERLEFLGDRVLGLAVAGMVYRAYPDESEGSLAKRLTALVQQAALVAVAQDIHLEQYVKSAGAAQKSAILSDAVEALIGAVYVDAGYAAAEKMVQKLWTPMLQSYAAPPEDPKTKLQEWAQQHGLPLPEYKVISRDGSDHAPVFTVEVGVQGQGAARAEAASKRAAEKDAAARLLETIMAGEI
jgi:ribonuclease-3